MITMAEKQRTNHAADIIIFSFSTSWSPPGVYNFLHTHLEGLDQKAGVIMAKAWNFSWLDY